MKRLLLFLLINLSVTAYSQQFRDTTLNDFNNGKAIWGDVNNDGYLDVFSFGFPTGGAGSMSALYIYNKNTQSFEMSASGPSVGFQDGSAAFGDFDNDNRLDLFITGNISGIGNKSKLYHNDGSGFSEYDSSSLFNSYSTLPITVTWADFNNDGNQDIFVGSTQGIHIYENIGRGNTFYLHTVPQSEISNGCFALADVDQDGLIDIFVSGYKSSRETSIYHNLNGFSFDKKTGSAIGVNDYPVDYGAVAFGDVDQNGTLDFVLIGRSAATTYKFAVYKQTGNIYFSGSVTDTDLHDANISLIDANGDGSLDLAYTGMQTGITHVATVDTNDGNGNFGSWAPSAGFAAYSGGSIEWGDYDRDGRPDLLICGNDGLTSGSTIVYTNIAGIPNVKPTIAGNLTSVVHSDTVTFTWDASADDNTNVNALTYHLRIDSNPSPNYLISPLMMGTAMGNMKLIPSAGNVGHVLNWTMYDVPAGSYKAYVYAMDNSYNVSEISNGYNFTVTYGAIPTCITKDPPDDITENSAILVADVTFPGNDSTATDLYFDFSTDGAAWTGHPYSGNPIKYTGTYTYPISGLAYNTTYYYKVRVINGNGDNEGGIVMFQTLPPAPSFGTPSYSSPIQFGTTLTITIPIYNYLVTDEVKIEYGSYFHDGNSEISMFKGSGDDWYADIDGSNITANGLWYFIKVKRGTNDYRYPDTPYNPKLVPVLIGQTQLDDIKHNKSAYMNGMPSDGWNTYSIPFEIGPGSSNNWIDLSNIFGNQDYNDDSEPTNWDAWDFGGTGINRVGKVDPNKAYFIYHTQGSDICLDDNLSNIGIQNQTLSTYNLNSMPVYQGWQLMPWPYLFTASFERKTQQGGGYRCGKLWIQIQDEWIDQIDSRFNGTLRPHGAYAFYSNVSGMVVDSLLKFTQTTMSKPARTYAQGEWEIKMMAFDGKKYDRCNYFGASLNATSAFDWNDEYEPRAMGRAVSAYFTANDNGHDIKLSADYRPVGNEGYTWDMNIDNRGNRQTIDLTWEMMNIKTGMKIILVDINNNETVDLNTAGNYTFNAMAANPFKIIAGNESYITQEIEKLQLPDKFTLYANYPNPFNPGTTIKYDLRLASNVKLSVYNTLGQLVRTLVNGAAQTTGTYTVEWDGKDQLGRMASTGVYIYRLDVKDLNGKTFTRSHKMLLIK